MLRGAKADFPGHAAEIDARLKEAFAAVPHDPSLAKMPPTDLVALLDENAELTPEGPEGEPMRALLAEKLMALDLPKLADPVLSRLMRAAPIGPTRASFGATLAGLREREGDLDGATLALSESNSDDMQDAVRERRAMIAARVQADQGDPSGAARELSAKASDLADEERAAILEQSNDWPGARDALSRIVARVIPPTGTLDDSQLKLMLRLATAAARADDDKTLAALRDTMRGRVGGCPQADLFRLLTAAPIRGTDDLSRARAGLGLARALTADTAASQVPVTTP